jgi:hypothetical protein
LRRVTTVKEMITGGAQARGEASRVTLVRRARKQAKSSGCDCAFLRACGLPACVCACRLPKQCHLFAPGLRIVTVQRDQRTVGSISHPAGIVVVVVDTVRGGDHVHGCWISERSRKGLGTSRYGGVYVINGRSRLISSFCASPFSPPDSEITDAHDHATPMLQTPSELRLLVDLHHGIPSLLSAGYHSARRWDSRARRLRI